MRSILFCNEMVGLGHLRLSLAVADALVDGDGSAALVVTGSPGYFGIRVPERVDVLRLPRGPIDGDTTWAGSAELPGALPLDKDAIWRIRGELSLAAVRSFDPDLVLVDFSPLGRGRDLLPALEWLRAGGRCTIALGLWEVDDEPNRMRQRYSAELAGVVARLFDAALVYGDGDAEDVRIERLRAVGVPIHHTGLVAAAPAERGPDDLPDDYLLATVGGGIDGFALLDTLLQALELRVLELPVVIVAGPIMPEDDLARLRQRASRLGVRVERTRADMDAVIAGARAVLTMAGYCTVAEILGSGKPALLVPRAFPSEEQLGRARRLTAAGRVQMLHPDGLRPSRLREAIDELLSAPPTPRDPLTGARDAAAILHKLVGKT